MFKSIVLKLSGGQSLTLGLKGITLFVGPNNSGKSLILREIEQAFLLNPRPTHQKLLGDFEIEWPSVEQARQAINAFKKLRPGELYSEGVVAMGRMPITGSTPELTQFHWSHLEQCLTNKTDAGWVTTQFLRWGVVRLDGRSRFALTDDRPGDDLLALPSNMLSHLFRDEQAFRTIREVVRDALGLYLVIDPTSLGQLRLRLSTTSPPPDEKSLAPAAVEFHGKAQYIKDASDGVQAFVGIAVAILSGEYHSVLLDEPEAFLHPPLARKLGKHLAAVANARSGSLVAATHSADFLMGCLSGPQTVQVVRMDYRDGVSRARLVDNQRLREMFNNPLMRSANVISALFHDGAVVTESDNDRAFYGEIYHRLMVRQPGLPSLLFINAQNKHTIPDIVGRLREFGVPAAAICDIDVIKEGGLNWRRWLEVGKLPQRMHDGLSTQRASLKKAFEDAGKDMKTDGGLAALPRADGDAGNELFDTLASYGIFVVRRGELEHWLPNLGVPGKKTDWAVNMLQRLGDDPASTSYVHPSDDDVWNFVQGIAEWMRKADRKGMD